MGSTRKSTKIWIPHPSEANCQLTGCLEQVEPDKSAQGRKIALILHGTMGHKDYLFQRKLALSLPMDSFRFDFRGNHESGGTWNMGALNDDVEDIKTVVQYLTKNYGYVVDLLVGHSRGSLVSMRWICTTEEGRAIRGFVNASGRYRMERIYGNIDIGAATEHYNKSFEDRGYFDWQVTVARKQVVGRVYPKDVEMFASWDISLVHDKFPLDTHVLTIHGLNDKTVPPFDAILYARVYGLRSPGTHTLHIIEEADHNLANHHDEVVETILGWLDQMEGGGLRTGVFAPKVIKARL